MEGCERIHDFMLVHRRWETLHRMYVKDHPCGLAHEKEHSTRRRGEVLIPPPWVYVARRSNYIFITPVQHTIYYFENKDRMVVIVQGALGAMQPGNCSFSNINLKHIKILLKNRLLSQNIYFLVKMLAL